MRIIASVREMQAEALRSRRAGFRIALVPTMGCLHEGHLSLMRRARPLADSLVVSIFVNPLQFGAGEDYKRYPRDMKRDEDLCRKEGVDIVFGPSAEDLYASDRSVFVDEDVLSKGLCGAFRPGHFRGVITVVAKLFNLTLPDVAVFGQKDAQQAHLIERVVRDLNFPVDIVVAPIVREPDGLAMSSRNVYLSPEERRQASGIYEALTLAERLCADGERDAGVVRDRVKAVIEKRMPGGTIDYIETADYRTFRPVDRMESTVLVAIAVRLGGTRLIDNAILRL